MTGWTARTPPLIGITGTSRQVDTYIGPMTWEGASAAYIRAVAQTGGIPVLLPAVLDEYAVTTLLDRLDGIVFTGGGDIDPACYGQLPTTIVYGVQPERDRHELLLLTGAWRRHLPILAICRGMQLLNVAFGGTLIQHLDDHPVQMDVTTAHLGRHSALVEPGSLLARVTGARRMTVNSMHHQAVDRRAASLRVSAWSEDGVPEAMEVAGRENVLAVQWHPEHMTKQAEHRALFGWLVDEAAAH